MILNENIVIFQEIKKETFNWAVVGAVWGIRFKDWVFLLSVARGGF